MSSVTLLVYDLSNGLAKSLSNQLLGTHIEAIYHTSVVVFGKEIFYGQGISAVIPKQTHYGVPIEEIAMGMTMIDFDTFKEFISQLKKRFTASNYHLLNFNCNTFTNEVCQFLLGTSIPSKIINLPSEFLSTPLGRMIQPMINQAFQNSNYQSVDLMEDGLKMAGPSVVSQNLPFIPYSCVIYPENDSEFNTLSLENAIYMFTSATCGPCQVIKPFFIESASTLSYPLPIFDKPRSVVAVIIDTSKCRQASMAYQIAAVPTFIKLVGNKKVKEIKGADRKAVEELFEYKHISLPADLVKNCEFSFNLQFNASKNQEKCTHFNINLNPCSPQTYSKALDIESINWYFIFDHLRYHLLSIDSSSYISLITTIINDVDHLLKDQSTNLIPYAPTCLCALRILINMFKNENILLYETVCNSLMQLLPSLIDSALFDALKSPIHDVLKNIGIWIAKRQGFTRSVPKYTINRPEDLFLMEYTSVACEFINKSNQKDLIKVLCMLYLHPEQKELINCMILDIPEEYKQYLK